MDTSIIEKYDRSRYNLVIGATIGWGVWFGLRIILPYISNIPLKMVMIATGLTGLTVAIVSFFRMRSIRRVIKTNPELGKILNNEWVIHTKRQAIAIGYSCMLLTAAIGIGIAEFIDLSGLLLAQIVLFVGILSMLIAHLFLLRDW